MKLIKTDNGFMTDDPAALHFKTTNPNFDEVNVWRLCSGPENGSITKMLLSRMEHIRTVGSESRTESARAGSAGWGTCEKISVYLHGTDPEKKGRDVVIASTTGLGPRMWYLNQLEAHHTFIELANTLPEHAMFDILHAITRSYDSGYSTGKHKKWTDVSRAFVTGTLMKRKVRGTDSYKVWIEEPPLQPDKVDGGTLQYTIDLIPSDLPGKV